MTVERAREMLPNVPSDVFDIFLTALIEGHLGWPFFNLTDSLTTSQWTGIFDPFSLQDFSELRWSLTDIEISLDSICERSYADIECVMNVMNGESHPLLSPRQCQVYKEKLQQQINFIQENGCIGSPVIVAYTAVNQLKIFDGLNRILASFILGDYNPQIVQAWVGSIPSE